MRSSRIGFAEIGPALASIVGLPHIMVNRVSDGPVVGHKQDI
jgi:hypothetical protein